MWIEAVMKPLRVQFKHGKEVHLYPGAPIELSDEDGQKLIAQAAGKVRLVGCPSIDSVIDLPLAPLQPGWLVTYRDKDYRLRGGCDERDYGTVAKMTWVQGSWTVWLTNGQALSLSIVRAVGKTDGEGRVVYAWTVRDHGHDGDSSGII